MKYIVRKKIHNTDRLYITQVQEAVMSDRVKTLISSGRILHIEELNLYYVLCDCYTLENFAEECLELRVVIDILNENTADIFHNTYSKDSTDRLKLLEDSLSELLPTKRCEKFAGENV